MPRHVSQVSAYFDALAQEYSESRQGQRSFQAQRALVLDMLEGAGGRVADVGCGPALMAEDLLAAGFEYCGVDVSAEMVASGRARLARQPPGKRWRVLLGSAEALPLPDASCGAVVAMGVLEYLGHYGPPVREMARVLRPGGVAVITVPCLTSPYWLGRTAFELLRRAAGRVRGRNRHAGLRPHRCVPWLLDRELGAARLRVIDRASCNLRLPPLPERWERLPPGLGAQYVVKAQRRG